jgi:cell division transport system permease protein
VRAPFILEGAIQGALGAAIAGLVLHYLLAWLGTFITGEFAIFLKVEPYCYGIVLAAGVLLGLAGSLIAVARFIGDEIAT